MRSGSTRVFLGWNPLTDPITDTMEKSAESVRKIQEARTIALVKLLDERYGTNEVQYYTRDGELVNRDGTLAPIPVDRSKLPNGEYAKSRGQWYPLEEATPEQVAALNPGDLWLRSNTGMLIVKEKAAIDKQAAIDKASRDEYNKTFGHWWSSPEAMKRVFVCKDVKGTWPFTDNFAKNACRARNVAIVTLVAGGVLFVTTMINKLSPN